MLRKFHLETLQGYQLKEMILREEKASGQGTTVPIQVHEQRHDTGHAVCGHQNLYLRLLKAKSNY